MKSFVEREQGFNSWCILIVVLAVINGWWLETQKRNALEARIELLELGRPEVPAAIYSKNPVAHPELWIMDDIPVVDENSREVEFRIGPGDPVYDALAPDWSPLPDPVDIGEPPAPE